MLVNINTDYFSLFFNYCRENFFKIESLEIMIKKSPLLQIISRDYLYTYGGYMAKVILLSGSPNENGNTVHIFREMARKIENNGVDAEVISLAGMNIKDVMNVKGGCDDGFDKVIEKIIPAEGLIVGGPVYWGTVRAELMTALHRIAMASMKNGNFLSRKIGGPVAVARRGGLTSSIQEMMMFFLYNDMIVPGSTYWNIVFGKAPGSALEDEEGMKTVNHFAENVAWLINKLK